MLHSTDNMKNEHSNKAELSKKIFIIDDDNTFCQVLVRSLRKRGYEAEYATETHDLIQTLLVYQPQYLSLDMKLSHSSGINLITPIKHELPSCKICVVTGYASIDTAVDAIKLGADNYLSKPISTEQLLSAFHAQPKNYETRCHTAASVHEVEHQHIKQILLDNHGNISATARALGMHRRTLQRKLKKYQIDIEDSE